MFKRNCESLHALPVHPVPGFFFVELMVRKIWLSTGSFLSHSHWQRTAGPNPELVPPLDTRHVRPCRRQPGKPPDIMLWLSACVLPIFGLRLWYQAFCAKA